MNELVHDKDAMRFEATATFTYRGPQYSEEDGADAHQMREGKRLAVLSQALRKDERYTPRRTGSSSVLQQIE